MKAITTIRYFATLGLLLSSAFFSIANSQNPDSSILFKDYKQFMLHVRDSIARSLLAEQLDDYNLFQGYKVFFDEYGCIDSVLMSNLNWKMEIDYDHEEIADILGPGCDQEDSNSLFIIQDGKFFVKPANLNYSNRLGDVVNVFPQKVTCLTTEKNQFETRLGVGYKWNVEFDNFKFNSCLSAQQIEAYRSWRDIYDYKTAKKHLQNKAYSKNYSVECYSWAEREVVFYPYWKKTKNCKYERIDYYDNGKVAMIFEVKDRIDMVKDGSFTYYDQDGNLKAFGNYANDIPNGTWLFYDQKGNKEDSIDYNKLINKVKTEFVSEIEGEIYNNDSLDDKAELGKAYDNGIASLLSLEFKLPLIFYRRYFNPKVELQFIIDVNGEVRKVEILNGRETELNLELMRVLYSSPRWIPAKHNGEPVNAMVKYVVNVD